MSEMRSMAAAYADGTSARTMGPCRGVGVIAGVTGIDPAVRRFIKIDVRLRDA